MIEIAGGEGGEEANRLYRIGPTEAHSHFPPMISSHLQYLGEQRQAVGARVADGTESPRSLDKAHLAFAGYPLVRKPPSIHLFGVTCLTKKMVIARWFFFFN